MSDFTAAAIKAFLVVLIVAFIWGFLVAPQLGIQGFWSGALSVLIGVATQLVAFEFFARRVR